MNTYVLTAEFDYLKPTTLTEALGILAEKKNVKVYAGGTDLIVKLKVGAPIGMDIMLDVNAVPELFGVTDTTDSLVIAAAEKIAVLEKNATIRKDYTALYEAFCSMASISVRNLATLGGNVCNASPVADAACPVLCYDGSFTLESLRGGKRSVKADAFFVSPGVTVIREDEILTQIVLPHPKENTGAAYHKLSRVKSDIAKLSVCVVFRREGDSIASCRMSMAAVAAKPLLLSEISDDLVGKVMTRQLLEETAVKIAAFIHPIDDNRTTAEYRSDVARVIARDTIEEAWKRTGGDIK
jgi:carbon-monoxide dehydrogenase medium subunit